MDSARIRTEPTRQPAGSSDEHRVTRLVVAEDNLLVREGLVSLISSVPELEVVATSASLPELLETVDRHQPDVVLTDICMPPEHQDEGIRAATQLRRTHPELGVVVLSQFVEPAYALALFEDGTKGRGYVLKDRVDEIDRLAGAIETVRLGGSFIDDEVVDALVRSRTRMIDSPIASLTERELDVLTEMATGATNSIIAERLFVSQHAVEKHSNAIFAKLGLTADAEINRRVKAVLVFLSGAAPDTTPTSL